MRAAALVLLPISSRILLGTLKSAENERSTEECANEVFLVQRTLGSGKV